MGLTAVWKEDSDDNMKLTAAQILQKAQDVLQERGKRYDKDGNRKMPKVVEIANVLGLQLSVEQGYKFMIALKLARLSTEDDYIDLINYVALLAEQQQQIY
jgi:hypothetical protein